MREMNCIVPGERYSEVMRKLFFSLTKALLSGLFGSISHVIEGKSTYSPFDSMHSLTFGEMRFFFGCLARSSVYMLI